MVSMSEIKLVGKKVRTNNANEAIKEKSKIASLVNEYFTKAIANEILNRKAPGKTFIVYYEYESNYKGDYTCFIGEEVIEFPHSLRDLSTHIIPPQDYKMFVTDSGQVPEVVINKWHEIWNMNDLEKIRNYQSDFELYDLNNFDPQNAKIEIYVGVK